jgi:hypothetical protein
LSLRRSFYRLWLLNLFLGAILCFTILTLLFFSFFSIHKIAFFHDFFSNLIDLIDLINCYSRNLCLW